MAEASHLSSLTKVPIMQSPDEVSQHLAGSLSKSLFG